MDNPLKTRCGLVALAGRPNAGKSTLLNALIGSKLAIVTPKAQTTRSVLRGIQIIGDSQIIYMDTPGIFEASQKYEQAMVAAAWSHAGDADMILHVVDASLKKFDKDIAIASKLQETKCPKVLVLNKIDKIKKPALLELTLLLNESGVYGHVFMVSAYKGDGVDELQQWLAEAMPRGPWLYPEDQISDAPVRFLAAEITREKLFLRLREELPYELMVETESWEQRRDGSIKVNQVIMVQRESHKKIILGDKGSQLKAIGSTARREIAKMMECEVHLFLFVKVAPHWKEQPEYLPATLT